MKQLKSVVILCDSYQINGGASKVARMEADALAKAGYNVLYFCADYTLPVLTEVQLNYKVYSIRMLDILTASKSKSLFYGIYNFLAAKRISRLLKSLSKTNTIVHAHGWTKALSASVIHKASSLGFKVVISLHSYEITCPNLGLYNYQNKHVCKLKPMSLSCISTHCDARVYSHKLWRVMRQFVQNSVLQIPHKVEDYIYVSKWSKDLIAPLLPNNKNYYFVANPIEVGRRVELIAQNSYFAYIGRLSPEKGVDIFLKACDELGCKGLVIGAASNADMTDTLKCPANVHFTGWQSSEEMEQYYSQIRVLVFPSYLYETMGLVVLEAASRGIPAIVASETAAVEFVEHEVTGLIFKNGDIESLKECMVKLSDNEYVSKLGEAAYTKFWRHPFTIDRHITELLAVYENL